MSPRPGGEADKLGGHYEGAWTAFHLLQVLSGRAISLTAEALGEEGKGVEFVLRRSNAVEAHQVKRQRGSANNWGLGDLRSEGVLEAARHHVTAGRQFHFVSVIPAQELNDLAERARNSPDLSTFVDTLPDKKVRPSFDYMCGVFGTPQSAWETLRGTWVHWTGERLLRSFNAALGGLLLRGAPATTAVLALCDLVVDAGLAVPLNHQGIVDRLSQYELELSSLLGSASVAQLVSSLLASWKASIDRELLRPSILRAEADELAAALEDEGRCMFVIGPGGTGKSAVLHGVVSRAEADGWAVLALRLDREEPFSSTTELGQRLAFGISPVPALAAVAQERNSLLIIDQLDAVSLASGRMPRTFDAVADLVREAAVFPNMRVLLACRKFDLENDDRIRTLVKDMHARQYQIPQLSNEQVAAAVEAMGLAADRLSSQQVDLLRLPVRLKVLSNIADQDEAFSFATTKDLYDAFWERKRRDCDDRRQVPVRFAEVVATAVEAMSSRQRMAVPVSIFDHKDLSVDADILTSEHVFVRDGRKVSFFHETFFDYTFARLWTRRRQTLVDFLADGEQELFRRAQVRQVLTYLREEDPERFVVELESLLSEPRIRYHIKAVALGLISGLPDPSTAEWRMVERLLMAEPFLADRLWLALRTRPWFDRLDSENVIAARLSAIDSQSQSQALEVMAGGVKDCPDRVAALLATHVGAGDYPTWLRRIVAFADVHENRSLFELVVEAVRRGEYADYEHELFMSTRDLGEHKPDWALELLVAHLVERPNAMELGSSGRVVALLSRDDGEIEMLLTTASATPRLFSEALVPYLLQVAALTSYPPDDGPIRHRHFMHSVHEPPHDVEEALQAGAAAALRSFVAADPGAARLLLERLAADPHQIAHWLLFNGLTASGENYAEYAAALLLGREEGLGVIDSWSVRRLILATSTYLSDESFARLEQAVVDFRPSWDGRPPGRPSFALLSAMDEGRLSESSRRRLGELRRLFNTEQPPEPEGISGGFIGSPIPQQAAHRMTDSHWLRAMAKHNIDRTDWTKLTGGAIQLSQVLKAEAKEDPTRFGSLMLELTSSDNPAYGEAILTGLGETDIPVDPAVVFEAVRHAASVFGVAVDRWLGWALRRCLQADIPEDIVGILLDRAINSPDPEHDSWSTSSPGGSLYYGGDPLMDGINTGRGHAAETLGNLVVYDINGHRTALVTPWLEQIASDPSVAVRACAAHLLAACLRHARTEATDAFQKLLETDDRLLATPYVERLIIYIGNSDSSSIEPIVRRMIGSADEQVTKAGGELAAYAGLELGLEHLLTEACASENPLVRKGAATVCAGRLSHTTNAATAGEALRQFFGDPSDDVRQASAEVAAALRDKALRPFERVLSALIRSPAFPHALSQLLITLDRAPDRVDELALTCAKQFVAFDESDGANLPTRAARGAREIGELLIRAYAQASGVGERAAILDLIDSLLASGAYGVAGLVEAAER